MGDVESLDDMALRVSERCRDIINEEMSAYFARLVAASGQRSGRYLKKPRDGPHAPKLPVADTKASRARDLVGMLGEGPALAANLERGLGVNRGALHSLVHYANEFVLGGTANVIKGKRGSRGKGMVYAIRDVDWKEGDGETV